MKTTSESARRSAVGRLFALATLFVLTPLSALLAPTARAQEGNQPDPDLGYIRLVNAVAHGEGNLTLHINGENMHPKGYRLGAVTGGMGFPAGTQRVTIRRDGVEEGSTNVILEKGATTTLIPYAERIPASDEKPAHWAIRILRLKQMDPESERSATFVSVASLPEIRVELGIKDDDWTSGFVKRLGVTQLPAKEAGGYVRLRVNNVELDAMAVPNAGNYVVVIYEDAEQKLKTLNFRDIRFLSAD
jgi:hypothetical protein